MRRRRLAHAFGIGFACAAVALVAGCGSSNSATTASTSAQTPIPANASPAYKGRVGEVHSFSTASAIVAALATAGLPCSGGHSVSYGGSAAPISNIVCTLRGTPVQINVYRDQATMSAALTRMATVACKATPVNTTTQIYTVTGDRWSVVSRTGANEPTILAALGGIPGEVNCGSRSLGPPPGY